MGRNFLGQQAFTVSEVLVSLVLSAGLAAVLFVGMSALRGPTDIQRKDFIKQKTQSKIADRFQRDLDAAVRVTGETRQDYPGIWSINSDGDVFVPGPNSEEPAGIGMLITRHDHLALPASQVIEPDGSTGAQIKVQTDPDDSLVQTRADIILEKLDHSPFVFIQNGTSSDVLKVSSFESTQEDFTLTFDPSNLDWEQYSAVSSPLVSSVHYVEWIHKDGKLKRIVRKEPGSDDHLKEEIITDRLTAFNLRYRFNASRRVDGGENVFGAGRRVGVFHPQDPSFVQNGVSYTIDGEGLVGSCSTDECCKPSNQTCLDWHDLEAVVARVNFDEELHSKRSQELIAENDADTGDLSEGPSPSLQLKHDSTQTFYPDKYSLLQGDIQEGVQGEEVSCSIRDPKNRCRPSCAYKFQNPNRGSLDWEGYGRYAGHEDGASAYCLCGTEGNDPSTFIPPDIPSGLSAVPAFRDAESDEEKKRSLWCIEHFDVRSYSNDNWRWKHPLARLISHKIKSDFVNTYYSPAPEEDPHLRTKIVELEAFDDWANDYITHRDTPSDGFWQEHMSCALKQSSYGDPQAEAWFTEREGEGISWKDDYRPWSEYCNCRGSNPGHADRNWLCNHNVTQASGEGPVCSTTWDGAWQGGQKVYKVRTDTNEDQEEFEEALSLNEAARCQCFADTYQRLEGDGSPVDIPASHGWAYSYYWDFRDTDPNSPLAPGDGVDPTNAPGSYRWEDGHVFKNAGSVVNQTVTFSYDDGSGGVQTTTQSCKSGSAIQNCMNPAHTCAERYSEDPVKMDRCYDDIKEQYKPADDGTGPDYSSYCHPSCGKYGNDEWIRITETRVAIMKDAALRTINGEEFPPEYCDFDRAEDQNIGVH